MNPEQSQPGNGEGQLKDKREHIGLADRLKKMMLGERAATPAELAQAKAEDDVAMKARQEARVQDLQTRADSGEVPVVPAAERYETGQTPVVSPAENPDTQQKS
ncbi:MAG: hypothetical protein U0526_01225 [Candidatus Saccharibacteria bacterium]|jgi:hypothetical protein